MEVTSDKAECVINFFIACREIPLRGLIIVYDYRCWQ